MKLIVTKLCCTQDIIWRPYKIYVNVIHIHRVQRKQNLSFLPYILPSFLFRLGLFAQIAGFLLPHFSSSPEVAAPKKKKKGKEKGERKEGIKRRQI